VHLYFVVCVAFLPIRMHLRDAYGLVGLFSRARPFLATEVVRYQGAFGS
jgi:hypothetical protein